MSIEGEINVATETHFMSHVPGVNFEEVMMIYLPAFGDLEHNESEWGETMTAFMRDLEPYAEGGMTIEIDLALFDSLSDEEIAAQFQL